MNSELNEIKTIIEEATRHPVLDKYIGRPEIDEDKITVLLAMFRENNAYKHVSKYISSILIVQMALEIHDSVTLMALHTPSEIKSRQLTVLAGDFYSAQYYSLLAEVKDYKMIGHISEAIQKLNELKTRAFKAEFHWDRLFGFLHDIESTILIKVAQVLGLAHWIPPLRHYFSLKRILMERKKGLEGEVSTVLQPFFIHLPKKKQQFIQATDAYLASMQPELILNHKEVPPVFSQLSTKVNRWKQIAENDRNKRMAKEGL
ncbi:heptaprenyl diphosphate synthase [Pullulanibacillus pueri]|uniref:Heptaprenyl diphosphate synthase component 1 n=1 Tax=Pullulanibacillus pueri TaxID=1437324 RepID=A0A8J3ELE0_9BACL|nr:heptaprenyl diphosphate synthase component 1 [Pullulanibacillus pueri]MBM7681467.1 heptaprenyl diphosphate synthase [Pullulanibacillus pueri]GGH78992.1 heptaprenyl diphosphate synthase component 1 [Pullulanibacillus pueri]